MKNQKLIIAGLLVGAVVVGLIVHLIAVKETQNANTLKQEAWTVFQNYLTATKNHDLPTLKSLSYQLSATCQDSTKIKDCYGLMDNAYYFGSGIPLKDITNVQYDSKQIILSSDYRDSFATSSAVRIREIIFFVRNGKDIKFLSFNPFQGVIINNTTDATSTLAVSMASSTKDTDMDGLSDQTEECDDQVKIADCVATNPYKKDTNGNGWWDSTESLFYKQPN